MKKQIKTNNLYQIGSPIIIKTFYQMSELDKYYQIKTKKIAIEFSNIISSKLDTLSLNVKCMDDYNKVIGETNCDFFELEEIVSGKTFGKNIYFDVPLKSSKYQAYVTKYKANGLVVTVEKSELVPYSMVYETPTLENYKAYYYENKLEAEGELVRDLYNDGNLIHCFCGETNHIGNEECYKCGITFEEDMVVDDTVIHAFMKKESETFLSKLQTKPEQYPIDLKTIKEDAIDTIINNLEHDLEVINDSAYETILAYIKEYLELDLKKTISSSLNLVSQKKKKEIILNLESLTLEEMFKKLESIEKKYLDDDELYGLFNRIRLEFKKEFNLKWPNKTSIEDINTYNYLNEINKYFNPAQVEKHFKELLNQIEKYELKLYNIGKLSGRKKHILEVYCYFKIASLEYRQTSLIEKIDEYKISLKKNNDNIKYYKGTIRSFKIRFFAIYLPIIIGIAYWSFSIYPENLYDNYGNLEPAEVFGRIMLTLFFVGMSVGIFGFGLDYNMISDIPFCKEQLSQYQSERSLIRYKLKGDEEKNNEIKKELKVLYKNTNIK